MIPNDVEPRREMISNMISVCRDSLFITEWEANFILSIEEQFEGRGNLTNRQCEILERIYDKVMDA
jgi:hypothetical protein